MYNIARRSEQERRELFRATAQAMHVHEAIIEKDFWVCWVLDYLFQNSLWKDKLVFKGGTSLSKAYHAIERFSEDIDLILDWRLLGYSADEPWQERSATRQNEFNMEANRPPATQLPPRHSRHYYDLYRLSRSPIRDKALAQLDLLQKVVDFKMKFYRSAWAKYEEARPGSLRLLPPAERLADLRRDYQIMQPMLFGTITDFEDILAELAALEKMTNDNNFKA